MAAIDETEELSIEVINGVGSEGEESTQKQSPLKSSPRAEEDVAGLVVTKGAAASAAAAAKDESDNDDDDDDFDETLVERLMGLTEMFPKSVQTATAKLIHGSISTIKGLYSFGRSASWVIFSTSAILFAPIIFEVERAQMEEMQKQQQRQILLGPGAAMSGGAHSGMGPGFGMAPPPPR